MLKTNPTTSWAEKILFLGKSFFVIRGTSRFCRRQRYRWNRSH